MPTPNTCKKNPRNCCPLEEVIYPVLADFEPSDNIVIVFNQQTGKWEPVDISEIAVPGPPGDPAAPLGGIILFDGNISTPGPNFDVTGLGIGNLINWALCNGNNGTYDLRNRFIPGAGGTYAQGATGGSDSVTLTGPQSGIQAHSVTITDPGHAHTASQVAHSHTFTGDPHGHSVTDPGHSHPGSTATHTHTVTDTGHVHGITDPGHVHEIIPLAATDVGSGRIVGGPETGADGSQNTETATTGITINSATTGIVIDSASPAVTVSSNTTGITIGNTTATGTLDNATPAVTVNSNTTGITAAASAASATDPHENRPQFLALAYIKRIA